MAAFTLTASDQNAAVRGHHNGLNVIYRTFTLNGAASLSASDVILVARIPNQAWLVDAYISGTTGGDATIWKLGTSVSDCALIALGTLSATAQLKRADRPLPFKVSLSDDAVPQNAWLFATRISGTSTATASIQFVVQYYVGGLP